MNAPAQRSATRLFRAPMAALPFFPQQTLRVGVTGLARAGKTAFLTSLAANLLAQGAGLAAGGMPPGLGPMPALAARLGGRSLRVRVAPSGAASMPRFDHAAHLAALAADPPRWPGRTDAVSLLALDIEIGRQTLADLLPPHRLRLELLDYPGEWLLDLPLLQQDFATWSQAALRRLEQPETAPIAADFLAFARGLPDRTPADETLAATGHALYRRLLHRLREELGLSLLQPGRFLQPAPGPEPPWSVFFPWTGGGPLAGLLRSRYAAYAGSVAQALVSPAFGRLDRLVILADVLAALHAGRPAFEDMAASLAAVAAGLQFRQGVFDAIPLLRDIPLPAWPLRSLPLPAWLRPGGIHRVAFAATKVDHVAERQRGNLASLVRALTHLPDRAAGLAAGVFAIASVRCTEDFVWTLDGRNVSAVRGRVLGDARLTRSYPGEVPDRLPAPDFWAHPFLALPRFEPLLLPGGGRLGVPQIGLDALLTFILDDVL